MTEPSSNADLHAGAIPGPEDGDDAMFEFAERYDAYRLWGGRDP
jgi:hypothetical protein